MIDWLLDLDRLALGTEGVGLGFDRPLAAWAWALVIAGAAAVSGWSYRKLAGPRAVRVVLAGVRAALVLLLVVLAAGPRLEMSETSRERDWVLVLVDRSRSLTITDAALPPTGDPGSGADARVGEVSGTGRVSRDRQIRAALAAAWPAWRELAEGRNVVWIGFDAGARDLSVGPDGPVLGEPAGPQTGLGSALERALARAAGRPLAGIVVVSDGRSTDEVSRRALRRLRSRSAPVFTVALGSPDPVADVGVARVEGPRSAFVGDVTPVRAVIETIGSGGLSAAATVRLVDTETGLVLDERRIEPGESDASGRTPVVLTHRQEEPGARRWAVEVESAAGGGGARDLIAENNRRVVEVGFVDRPMRVLYLDGYPRWEQRYLRNLLLREESVLSSSLLLAADRRYTQEGNVELGALPASPEEWAEYDVIVLGDLRPDVLTRSQLEQMRDHVSVRGAGLVWMGGPAQTPGSWFETPLGDLLPMGAVESLGAVPEPFVLEPASASERLGVLRLSDDPEEPWPAALTDASAGWSTIWWGQLVPEGIVKPTAEVLAWARGSTTGARTPAALTMRFGSGRSVYVATDEVWRYRFGRGEVLFERFWLQLIRMAGRESLARSGESAVLTVAPERATLGQPVRVAVELLDEALASEGLSTVTVELERVDALGEPAAGSAPVEVEARREAVGGGEAGGAGVVYAGTWLPTEPGRWVARAGGPTLAGLGVEAEAVVAPPLDELRTPDADHELLARLAEETGGAVVDPASLGELPARLPNRSVTVVTERTEALWDTPLALIAVLTLLTVEWVGRRLVRLV